MSFQTSRDEQLQQLFQYHAHDVEAHQTLFLLHGTGGSETDLLPLVAPFQSTHNIVGLLGNIREHGMARFFARSADGRFDQLSIQTEVEKLHRFVTRWLDIHQNSNDKHSIRFVGYSNGANMIIAYLFLYPQMVESAALLHPMLPFQPPNDLDLIQNKLFVSWGSADPMVPVTTSHKLVQSLKRQGAQLTLYPTHSHSIDTLEITALQHFLQNT